MWHNLDVAAQERKVREEKRKQQKQRQQRARLAPRRELPTVFMSEQNRRIVEELLGLAGGGGVEEGLDALPSESTEEGGGEGGSEAGAWDGDGNASGEDDSSSHNSERVDGEQEEDVVWGDSVALDGEWEGGARLESRGKRGDGVADIDEHELENWEAIHIEAEHSPRGRGLDGDGSEKGERLTGGSRPTQQRPESAKPIEEISFKLRELGFQEAHVERAIQANVTMQASLDWLILNLEEADLPTTYAPDSSQASLQVLNRRHSRQSTSLEKRGLQSTPTVARLMEYGYSCEEAEAALFLTNGDEEAALCELYWTFLGSLKIPSVARGATDVTDGTGLDPDVLGRSGLDAVEAKEMREEELVAMAAIYGDDALLLSEARISLRLPPIEGMPGTILLEILIPPSCAYPLEAPVLAVRGAVQLPGAFLQALTASAAQQADKLRGSCMVYEIASSAAEDAPRLWSKHSQEGNRPAPPGYAGRGGIVSQKAAATANSSQVLPRKAPECREMLTAPPMPTAVRLASPLPRSLSTDSRGEGVSPRPPAPYLAPGVRRTLSGKLAEEAAAAREEPAGSSGNVARTRRGSTRGLPGGRHENSAKVAAESMRLLERWHWWQESSDMATMRSVRQKLPAQQERQRLLDTVSKCPVTVVCGQTGCGKSTQVPQFLLESFIERGMGGACNVVCTQPRRISAIGLADRVAQERNEAVGETVGYSIRLENKLSDRTRLLFCTTGILLRRLLSDPDLNGLTHVIVDEVHERSVDGDLLLLLLQALLRRQATRQRGGGAVGGKGGLRVILMSATVNARLFADYFAGQSGEAAPSVVSIPGFTHPVRELYLEDALELTGVRIGRASKYAKRKGSNCNEPSNLSASSPAPRGLAEADSWEEVVAEQKGGIQPCSGVPGISYSEATSQSLANVDEEIINYELMEAVICHILGEGRNPSEKYGPLVDVSLETNTPAGAILVFLPGMAEIRRLQNLLNGSRRITEIIGTRRLWVLPLHGSLSGEDQRRVFVQPPRGVLKIVLATNIAETSVTIDDVVYVIDSGRHKETRYDHTRHMAALEDSWVSQASAGQRRGRAGRVRPGCCIRLFSHAKFRHMAPQQQPEMLRVPLESLCLQVKSLLPGRVEAVLAQALTPPQPDAIHSALQVLTDLSALDEAQELTPLGCHLALMPVDPRVGKMLVYACLLQCLDPILSIAAAMSSRPPFLSPPLERRAEAAAAKARLAGTTRSDQLAVANAFSGWSLARTGGGGWEAERVFCEVHFLSRESMVAMEAARTDFANVLVDLGFVPEDYLRSLRFGGDALREALPGGGTRLVHAMDANSSSLRVVKAALCAGLYPHVARVQHPETTYCQLENGTVAKEAAAHEVRLYGRGGDRLFLHPASVNFSQGRFDSPWLAYGEKVQTAKVYLRETTMVPAYALLLMGGKIGVVHARQLITLDGWMEFQAPARVAVLVRELRTRLASLLAAKIEDPALDIASSPVVTAVVRLLSTDGF